MSLRGKPDTVIALCGGVGGAKLARGLYDSMEPAMLAIVVNTGDDFEHFGLTVCPDIDTVLYTLAGLNDRQRGWGRADETWSFMEALSELGGQTWFQLGDKDLATHLVRSDALREGRRLNVVTDMLARSMGIKATVLPMTNDRLRTMVDTNEGELSFQRYFVERRCEPEVRRCRFAGAESATPVPGLRATLQRSRAIIICPSNPYLSIDPLLSIPGMRALLKKSPAPVVAVSPIVDGDAVKGPLAKIMGELDLAVNSLTVARHYQGLIDGLVVDSSDQALVSDIEALGIDVHVTPTLMRNCEDQQRVAAETMNFADQLVRNPHKAAIS